MLKHLFLLCILLLLPAFLSAQRPAAPELVTDEQDPFFGAVRWDISSLDTTALGFQKEAEDLLRVYTQLPEANGGTLPPMLGAYTLEAGRLVFRPRFPFLAGRSYWVWYDGAGEGAFKKISIPGLTSLKPPRLTQIYPSATVWPANQLKCYLYFDQPMRSGYSLEHIKLYEQNGKEVKAPFLDMGQELWDPEQKRLTVWFDPGRIKSGLIPNEQLGPPLYPDKTYRLVIRQSWPAANGLSLAEEVVKVFQTGPKDITRPDPENWEFRLPAPGGKAPLAIHFPEAMDIGLLESGLILLDAHGEPVQGAVRIGPEEKSWQFSPASVWEAADYRLRIRTDLEDLAGNNLLRLFDRPVSEVKSEAVGAQYLERVLKFRQAARKQR